MIDGRSTPVDAAGWLEQAESEPCFRYRMEPVRDALAHAAALITAGIDPTLDARIALRRAMVELADEQPAAARELADLATVAAERAGDRTRVLLARIVSARAALRIPELQAHAASELETIASEVTSADEPTDRLLGTELGAQLAIAMGEQLFASVDLSGARRAFGQAEDLLQGAPARALADTRFQALQGTALAAQVSRSFGRAADRMRSLLRLVTSYGSPRDELEARMALGHMLTQLGKHDDAVKHMDRARALAKDCAGVDERILATQSAALAALHGKSYGRALDRAYEALQLAGLEKRDLSSYIAAVSLISQIHLVRGNHSEAYLALVYASASLKQRLGPQATVLVDAQTEELKRSMGPAKFEAMCEGILRARQARESLERPDGDGEPEA